MTKSTPPHQSPNSLPPAYIGLPQWQHSRWPNDWFGNSRARKNSLSFYAEQLNSIEGNTTFYAMPDEKTVLRWYEQTNDDFRFVFKLHQSVTHNGALDSDHPAINQQLRVLMALGHKLALILIQLPASVGPQSLPSLARLLDVFPEKIGLAVEVRHPAFFAKGEAERRFNRLLLERSVNRVIMDTRGLFRGPSDNALTAEVRTKKPRLPVNVIATANHPILRFVGGNDTKANEECLRPWVTKCHQWRKEGRSPFLYFHRPDNGDAPWLADKFIRLYNQQFEDAPLPELSFPAQTHSQTRLF